MSPEDAPVNSNINRDGTGVTMAPHTRFLTVLSCLNP